MSKTASDTIPLEAAFSFAEDVTRKTGSNLWFVSRMLGRKQKQFFNASYCSMRLVDDYVDEVFLKLSDDKRNAQREGALFKLEKWVQFISRADQNTDTPHDFFLHFPNAHWIALHHCFDNSNIPLDPWIRLASAMRHDILEKPLQNWDDFLAYCDGATVAPAEIFLFVLGIRENAANQDYYVQDYEEILSKAKAMAVFCYLVHIMRDLNKDVLEAEQILTLPLSLRLAKGFFPGIALKDQAGPAEAILDFLLHEAHLYQDKLQKDLVDLKSLLPKSSYQILTMLMSIYQNLLNRVETNKALLIEGKTLPTQSIRESLMNRLDLSLPS